MYLEDIDHQMGKTASEPFVFLIKPSIAKVNYHVIDCRNGTSHTPTNHKQFAWSGELIDQKITILGFNSDHHQGIFTHHDSKTHLHFITENSDLVDHVDQLKLKGHFSLSIAN